MARLTIEEINKRIDQLKNQKEAILARQKEKDRKDRTRRLIQVGALAEKFFGEKPPEEYEQFFAELKEKSGL